MLRLSRDLRSNDFDLYGHLNQAIYHVLLEDARIAYVDQLLGRDFKMVLARIELDHRREIPPSEQTAVVEVEVSRVGRSSFVLGHLIRGPGGEIAAEGSTVMVAWDPEARTSRPLTEQERAALAAAIGGSEGSPAGPTAATGT